MAGMSTAALATLNTINTVRRTANSVDQLTGGPARRRRKAQAESEARDRAVLEETQASRLAELQAEQALEEEIAGGQRAARETLMRAEAASDDRRRTRALRAAVSRTRARLGGQGLSATDGSGEAILLGLVRQTAEEEEEARRLDKLRLAALDGEATARQRRNLLDLTRLQERQRLERLARGFG